MSSGGGAGPLVPTFHGFVHNSMDGLVLFEACLSGKLHHVPRRPHDRERSSLIKSGSIFIYEENASGIKRWTDGVAWSPSRILGNFLIYRELEKPFPPGEKKRAMKRKRTSLPGEPYPRPESEDNDVTELPTPLTPPSPHRHPSDAKSDLPGSDQDKELERSLIGSLVDSYGFRPDGLVKKTMSISVNGISHHMVSYYKVDDVKNNLLPRPLSDARLQHISVRPELYLKQNFRAPVEETEHYAIDGHMHAHPQVMYAGMNPSAYALRPGQYFGGQYPMYSMSTTPGVYGGLTGTSWSQPNPSIAYNTQGGYSAQGYGSSYYKAGGSDQKVDPTQSNSQSMAYGNHYATSYQQGMQRSGSHGTPGMIQTSYSSASAQPIHSPYGSASSHPAQRHSYSGASSGTAALHSPTSVGQPQHYQHASSTQPYAVRSPTQNYTIHGASASGLVHSPHSDVKSPMSGTPTNEVGASLQSSGMHYRSDAGSYSLAHSQNSAHSNGGLNGLGITSGPSYANHGSAGQSYANYATPAANFRSVSDVGVTQGTAQYAA